MTRLSFYINRTHASFGPASVLAGTRSIWNPSGTYKPTLGSRRRKLQVTRHISDARLFRPGDAWSRPNEGESQLKVSHTVRRRRAVVIHQEAPEMISNVLAAWHTPVPGISVRPRSDERCRLRLGGARSQRNDGGLSGRDHQPVRSASTRDLESGVGLHQQSPNPTDQSYLHTRKTEGCKVKDWQLTRCAHKTGCGKASPKNASRTRQRHPPSRSGTAFDSRPRSRNGKTVTLTVDTAHQWKYRVRSCHIRSSTNLVPRRQGLVYLSMKFTDRAESAVIDVNFFSGSSRQHIGGGSCALTCDACRQEK